MNIRDLLLRIRALTASLIAVSVPTLRAARIDPIATLRKD